MSDEKVTKQNESKVIKLDEVKKEEEAKNEPQPVSLVPIGFLAVAIVKMKDPQNQAEIQQKMVAFVDEFIKPSSEIRQKILDFGAELSKLVDDVDILMAPLAPMALQDEPAKAVMKFMESVGPSIGINISSEGLKESK